MTDIHTARRAAADLAYEEFQFLDGCAPETQNGWEDDGLGTLTRAIFVPDADNPAGPTLHGVFSVSFMGDSETPSDIWATVDGEDIGFRPKPASSEASGLSR